MNIHSCHSSFLIVNPFSYATQCFEGMKLYRGYDGKLRLFRPDLNAARLAMSSARVALPSFDTEEFVKLLKAFLKIDGPRESGTYCEPVVVITQLIIVVRLASQRKPRELSLPSSSHHW